MDELLIEPEPTERELGTAPIKPLFARYAAITFAGMLAQMVMVVLEGLIIGNGLPCTVIGHSERGLERCRKSIEQNWDDLIAEGLATEGNKQAAMAPGHHHQRPCRSAGAHLRLRGSGGGH